VISCVLPRLLFELEIAFESNIFTIFSDIVRTFRQVRR
jgi:hypothetical protein